MHQSYDGYPNLNPKLRSGHVGDYYAFPMHQVYLGEDGTFQQTRSGPNWEGGLLTLSTCKHHMRATRAPEDWKGVWVAGFGPKTDGENYLLFLGLVTQAFASNYEMGLWLRKNYPKAYRAKQTAHNPLGDVFTPHGSSTHFNPHDRRNYVVHPEHVRWELKRGVPKWHSDVNYVGVGGRQAVSFVFEEACVFSKPMYRVTRPLHRSGWRTSELTQYLEKTK